MIVNLIFNVVVLFLGAIFSWLPAVDKLPTIVDYDIDTALVSGVGQFKSILDSFWVLGILLSGALAILAYYGIKMVLKFFLGHRAPGH